MPLWGSFHLVQIDLYGPNEGEYEYEPLNLKKQGMGQRFRPTGQINLSVDWVRLHGLIIKSR